MSAFGRKSGPGGRPQFGIAKPMRGGTGAPSDNPGGDHGGGEQFPPLPDADSLGAGSPLNGGDAMARLSERMNTVHSGDSTVGGFEASIH